MNKRNKGFTLIELLAVIVILAIIALIAVPVVMNIINKANKSAFKDSAYGIIKAGELYYTNELLNNTSTIEDKTFTFPNDTLGLEIKGSKPTGGSITVNKQGQVQMAITNDKYCVTKRYEDDDVLVTEDVENCKVPLKLGDVVYYNPVEDKVCTNYVEANSLTGVKEGCMRWYVYYFDEEMLALILDHNTTAAVAWNDTGENLDTPVTLNAQFNLDTQSWKAQAIILGIDEVVITPTLPWFDGLEDKSNWEEQYRKLLLEVVGDVYSTIDLSTYPTVLDGYKAMTNMIVTKYSDIALPTYLYEDLLKNCSSDGSCTTSGYWTCSPVDESNAWTVTYSGILGNGVKTNATGFGVRPVIIISK